MWPFIATSTKSFESLLSLVSNSEKNLFDSPLLSREAPVNNDVPFKSFNVSRNPIAVSLLRK